MAAAAVGLPEAGAAVAQNGGAAREASMADARASCEFAAATWAGDSRATASAEWPAAAGAVAGAADVAHAPADAVIVDRPT